MNFVVALTSPEISSSRLNDVDMLFVRGLCDPMEKVRNPPRYHRDVELEPVGCDRVTHLLCSIFSRPKSVISNGSMKASGTRTSLSTIYDVFKTTSTRV